MQDSYNKINHSFFFISGIYFVFLLVILWLIGYTPHNDSDGYIEYAYQCIEQGEIYPCNALITGEPFIWNIGIINLILASFVMFKSYYPILFFMCFMKATTALLLSLITKELAGYKVAFFTLLIYILYPNNWAQSTMLMSEIPMVFLSMIALFVILKSKKTYILILSGILFGIANWFRPTIITYIIPLFIFLFIYKNKKEVLRKFIFMIIGLTSIILIIGIDSKIRTGHFIYKAESFWFNMVDHCYDGSPVKPHYNTDMYAKDKPRYIENMEQKTCFECSEIWRERSIKWLKNNPLEYLSKIPGRLYYMYMNDMDNLWAFSSEKHIPEKRNIQVPFRSILSKSSQLTALQWFALLSTIIYYSIITMAFLSVVRSIKRKQFNSILLPLLIVLLGSIAIVLAIHGETRFKDPFMPFIIMMAAHEIKNILYKTDIHKNK